MRFHAGKGNWDNVKAVTAVKNEFFSLNEFRASTENVRTANPYESHTY